MRLLVKGKQFERALDLLIANEVPLTEALAEALTPQKTADNVDQRNAELLRLAQVCLSRTACCAAESWEWPASSWLHRGHFVLQHRHTRC